MTLLLLISITHNTEIEDSNEDEGVHAAIVEDLQLTERHDRRSPPKHGGWHARWTNIHFIIVHIPVLVCAPARHGCVITMRTAWVHRSE